MRKLLLVALISIFGYSSISIHHDHADIDRERPTQSEREKSDRKCTPHYRVVYYTYSESDKAIIENPGGINTLYKMLEDGDRQCREQANACLSRMELNEVGDPSYICFLEDAY